MQKQVNPKQQQQVQTPDPTTVAQKQTTPFVDHRPQTQKAVQLQSIANAHTEKKAFVDNREKTPPIQQKKKSQGDAPTVMQLKKASSLKKGTLNMVGESHNDYNNQHYRQYEAATVRKELGSSYQYYLENHFKINPSAQDYADPTDQRLKQIIALIRDSSAALLPKLQEQQDVLERDVPILAATDVSELIGRYAQRIQNRTFDLDAFKTEVNENTPPEQIYKLNIPGVWDQALDPQDDNSDDSEDNDDYEEYKEDQIWNIDSYLVKLQAQLEQQQVEEGNFNSAAFNDSKRLLENIPKFVSDYQGRLPQTMKLYYALRNEGVYNGGNYFDFSLDVLPAVIQHWSRIETLSETINNALTSDEYDDLNLHTQQFIQALTQLQGSLENGVGGDLNALNTEGITADRSKFMHNAAQENHNAPVVWKVGQNHINDIERLEKNQEIDPTKYTYLTKDDFKNAYINQQQMATYQGTDDDLGADGRAAQEGYKEQVETAENTFDTDHPQQ